MRIFFLAIALFFAIPSCNNRLAVQCEQNANCDLSGGGMCVAGSTGNWCAYPDPDCAGGYRYSSQDGNGVAGQCVAASPVDAGVDSEMSDGQPVDGPPVVPGSWAKQVPGAGFESVNSLAVAADGSMFVGGAFDGTLDLGGGPMTATGTQDLFVAKFTASGDHLWSVHFGGTGTSTAGATKIAILSNGELAIAGNYTGTLKFGTTTLTSNAGSGDVFVARLTTTGGAVWAEGGGSSGFDALHDMAIDGSDNIVVCGGINTGGGAPPTGSFFGVSLTGSNDAWLVTLNGDGAHLWGKEMAAGGLDDNCGVAMASNGDVIFVGNYNGMVNAGGSTFTSDSGSLDMYFARFKGSDGTHIWSESEGGTGNDEALDVDTNGTQIVVTGRFDSSISFGGSSMLTTAGGDDAFVAQFDASTGGYIWATGMGGTSDDVGLEISTRSDGQVTVAGQFAGTANFGGTMISSNGDIDPFVVDLDGSSGAVLGVKSVGGPSRDEANAVASTTDSLVFGGAFSTSIKILNQTYTSMGGLDGYVVRYKR